MRLQDERKKATNILAWSKPDAGLSRDTNISARGGLMKKIRNFYNFVVYVCI
jgi:hypothetical protein